MSLKAGQELTTQRPRLKLDGVWAFSYDPQDKGVKERWFDAEYALPERITVPGCSQARHYDSAGVTKEGETHYIPELSMDIMLRHPSMAPSWWKRSITIPDAWRSKRIWLHLGGVCPAAELWVNGENHGRTRTSRSPVRCDITRSVRFGEKNEVALRLEWPEGPRLDGLWNCTVAWTGIYRSAWIEATDPTHLAEIEIIPSINPPSAFIRVTLVERQRKAGLRIKAEVCRVDKDSSAGKCVGQSELLPDVTVSAKSYAANIAMPGAELWSLDHPCLHQALIRVFDGDRLLDEASMRFGLREMTTRRHQVLLNGNPVFLRGGCDDMCFPETICPPADKEFHRHCITLAKQYGFNYAKSCVEIFTKEYLDAADEEGYLVCQEMPFGLVGGAPWRNARFNPSAALRKLHRQELENIVHHSRNHPSVILYSMASELANAWRVNKASFQHFSQDLPALARTLAPRALVVDCTGESGVLKNGWCTDDVPIAINQPHGMRDTDLQCSVALWPAILDPFFSRSPIVQGATRPYIFHEYCWITSLSDPALIRRLARLPIKPLMIPEMIELARRNGQAAELPAMVEASRKLKMALRKHVMEVARMEPWAAGYHHWLVQDWVHAAEGVFNEFWEAPKDLCAEEFRQCNADTVICLEAAGQRCFIQGERVELSILVSHFGPAPLLKAALEWRVLDGKRSIAEGRLDAGTIAEGTLAGLPALRVAFPEAKKPSLMMLVARLESAGKLVAENRWNLWSVPAETSCAIASTADPVMLATFPEFLHAFEASGHTFDAKHVRVERSLSDELISWIEDGGRALFLADRCPREPLTDLPRAKGADIPNGYEYQYRTVPYNLGKTGNMGTLIHDHPALGDLPHDGWCDFVFQPLLEDAAPIAFDPFKPNRIKPIIRSIGHMASMDDKGYLFEISVGRGRLMVSSMNLVPSSHLPFTSVSGRGHAQETTPFASYLLRAILQYLRQDSLLPATGISAKRLRDIRT